MKTFLLVTVLVFLQCRLAAQENKIVKFNEVRDDKDTFLKSALKYPQFVMGEAILKTGEKVQARFNYNYLNNKLLFLDQKGDTLEPANPENFSAFAVQKDTFYFSNKEYILQITHFHVCNLFVKQKLRYTGTEKKGAYGMYSSVSSSTSQSTFSDQGRTHYLQKDANEIYQFDDNYFVADKFNKFYPATKKGIYDLFWKHEKQIKAFVENNKTDFNKEDDLKSLLTYIQTLE